MVMMIWWKYITDDVNICTCITRSISIYTFQVLRCICEIYALVDAAKLLRVYSTVEASVSSLSFILLIPSKSFIVIVIVCGIFTAVFAAQRQHSLSVNDERNEVMEWNKWNGACTNFLYEFVWCVALNVCIIKGNSK